MKNLKVTTLADLCLLTSEKYGKHTAFAMLEDGVITRRVSYEQMGSRSRQISSLLKQLGIVKGDRVILFADNSPEWGMSYFGIALANAVSVPLLTGFSTEQIQNIVKHSDASAICLTNITAERLTNIEEGWEYSKIPLIYIDTIKVDKDMEITVSVNGNKQQMTVPLENSDINAYNPEDLATLIYTSGTSGNSKGVMLSSRNLISSALSSLDFVNVTTKDRVLSVLPLAHSYECSLGFLATVYGGSTITYIDRPPSPSVLLPAVKLVRPTIMLSVPLLIEKIYNNGVAPKLAANKLYKFPLTRPLAIRVAGRKMIKALGGKIRFFGIGGAPLSKAVEDFLHRAGFPYAIGYGLTEAAPLVAGNAPLHFSPKTGLGAPTGVTMRIEKCPASNEPGVGEIQVKGPNVMMGYYKDSEQTAEAITPDGWLRTGDLGRMEKKGRLFIRGRLKALILGPSGENIYPEEIEGLLNTSTLVEDALVYSSEKGELVAMVRLSEAAKAAAGAIEHVVEDLRTWVNTKLAVFSRLNRIEIRHEPFEKTPTMKIKRYLYV